MCVHIYVYTLIHGQTDASSVPRASSSCFPPTGTTRIRGSLATKISKIPRACVQVALVVQHAHDRQLRRKTSDSLLAFTSFLTKDFGSIAKYFLRSLALFLTRMGSWRHLDVQALVMRKIVTRSSAASRQQRSRRIDAHHKCVSTKATGLLRGQNV